jgi:hypothetical protein
VIKVSVTNGYGVLRHNANPETKCYKMEVREYLRCILVISYEWFDTTSSRNWVRQRKQIRPKCVTFITNFVFIFPYFTSLNLFVDCTHILLSQSGDISSDNYPNNYSPNTDCMYIITPPKGDYKNWNIIENDVKLNNYNPISRQTLNITNMVDSIYILTYDIRYILVITSWNIIIDNKCN